MADAVDLGRLRVERALRRVSLLALGEAFIILSLMSWLAAEYHANPFMQEWIGRNLWPAGLLLNGTLVGVAAGILIGWVVATFGGRRSREQKVLDSLRRIV